MKNITTGSASPRKAITLVKMTLLIGAVALTASACSSTGTANAGYHTERVSPNAHEPAYKIVPDAPSK